MVTYFEIAGDTVTLGSTIFLIVGGGGRGGGGAGSLLPHPVATVAHSTRSRQTGTMAIRVLVPQPFMVPR
jgi:hypothetical protein